MHGVRALVSDHAAALVLGLPEQACSHPTSSITPFHEASISFRRLKIMDSPRCRIWLSRA